MKLATKEELEGHQNATIRGAIEGTVAGLALALPLGYLANRRWPAFRALPPQLKALAAILIVIPAYSVQAERRGVEFDESTWTGAGAMELRRVRSADEAHWESLSAAGKFKEWAMHNQYKVIVGSWAASMALAGAIVMANRHQTMPQKIVQARMWAQGLTIGVIIGAGVLTQSQRQKQFEERSVDHSWANIIEEQQREDEEVAAHKAQKLEIPAVLKASV
ncbi:Respiratory supercomplex factor 2, mitochondrial [Phanerochaete sordida]|uniref:Respiratory supercomplex factor 2, mitochondrial n=1 Tax=Phanerochaete sordida TaxID=48140 RepID=A0A9P3FW39_9APHY|nr:Respiratory supercomplex factor 2, mitochondrial [Phanerochaete sordida]